jgi:NADH-quinone oxidoreductase subunit L
MLDINTLLIAVPALPLAAALLTAALGKRVLRGQSHWPTVVALVLACGCSGLLVWHVDDASRHSTGQIGYEHTVTLWTWANVANAQPPQAVGDPAPRTADFNVAVVLRADALTAIMLAMVTFISTLVAVYSIGYMRGDPGYWRFFTYIALFVFSMTMLVSVSNFVLLYVFWEAVGVCSYLLIGFWFQKPEAAAAGKKAFLVNRVGDFGFALGLFLIWVTYGTLDFHDTIVDGSLQSAGVLGQHFLTHPQLYVGGGVGLAICLLLMAGACGKSAQFPLHVWLPDAMEGPTPVSALIHAATMVTAGVYMVVRCLPLFLVSVTAQQAVALIGCFTALMAGLIAITQTDLKRILAYSTISQLGFMFLGLGTATVLGATAGMFQLFTHAFFKALLFLGAGSVMHAMGGVIDVHRIGGLRRIMPITHATFLIGCLALAGVFPFSGFFSKDLILLAVRERAYGDAHTTFYFTLYVAALGAAGLTAFYAFRALFLTFYGPQRIPHEAGHHAHESPPSMTIPLAILAGCALAVGAYFEWTHGFADFFHRTPQVAYGGLEHVAPPKGWSAEHWQVAILSTIIALAGIVSAAVLYLGNGRLVASLTRATKAVGLYQLSYRKFYWDEIYVVLIVAPLRVLAWSWAWFDRAAIDGLVDLFGSAARGIGSLFRPLQNGLIQFYALAMLVGVLVLIGALLM